MKRNIFKAFFQSTRKHWLSWVITLIAMIVGVSLEAITPYLFRGIVNTFTSNTPDVALAKTLFVKLILAIVVINIVYRIFDFALATHEARAIKDIENRCFQNMQRQSMRFFEDNYSGALITRARRFRGAYESITDLFFFGFGHNLITFIVIAVVFTRAMPGLALPFIAWSLVFVAYCLGTSLWKYRFDVTSAKKDSAVGASLADSLTNQYTIKTFGRETSEEGRFAAVVHENYQARMAAWMRGNIINIGQWILISTGKMSFLWWLIVNWERGLVTAGDFVFAQMFIVWAVTHLVGLGHQLKKLFGSIADAEEMAAIYVLKPEVRDALGSRNLLVERGEIEFHSVTFSYDNQMKSGQVINAFSLNIAPRQSVGLVGRSGAGKSTLVKLLLRFYDLNAGYIRIDGQDIADVTQVSLRQNLAVVPQHPQLFHRTVRENISFACPEASETEIIQAAKLAYAWDFIQELPEGLDTLVGERGIKLSGGEQQRVAIARAILADPQILILDEATSALDSATEKLIQKAIANLLERRTAIVIAHRLSTIMSMDRIVVMDYGRIVECGSHGELLDKDGIYARLWSHHTDGFIR